MPVAEFPGRFGWGYDGVEPLRPDAALRHARTTSAASWTRAHALGLGVILDVVYNHLGPDGNYLAQFADDYFTDRHKNEWGEAINFDGPDAAPVREFFIANAGYWIDEFHLDGLRLDATQAIFDDSPRAHPGRDRPARCAAAARGRATHRRRRERAAGHAKLVRPPERGRLRPRRRCGTTTSTTPRWSP